VEDGRSSLHEALLGACLFQSSDHFLVLVGVGVLVVVVVVLVVPVVPVVLFVLLVFEGAMMIVECRFHLGVAVCCIV